MAIEQIIKSSIGDQVFEQLKKQLLNSAWSQGEKIPSENELAQSLGVSRVTVRQAIQKLTVLGLLETRPGEGSFVKEPKAGVYMNGIIPIAYLGENSLNEVLEFRRTIEGVVAELAALKINDEEIEQLEKCLKDMELNKDDLKLFSVADVKFHLTLAKATQNSLFIEIFNIMNDVLYDAMTMIVNKRGNSAGLHYHRLIVNAIKERNSDQVKKIMDEHMEDTVNSFKEYSNN